MTDAEAFSTFVGGWQLVRWATFHPDGSAEYPFGTDAIGQIMYSADGHMSCHLQRAGREHLAYPSIFDVPDPELGATIRGYSGYFGSFSIDAAAGVITHHVTGAWFPNFAAVDQPRHYAFEGEDLLHLEAQIGEDLQRLTWQRQITGEAHRLG